MDNFIFCLNATIPIFALMVLGIFFRKVNILKEQTIKEINGFVFNVSLPALLFQDLAGEDFAQAWDGGYVLFCFVVTCISITIAVLVSLLLKDKSYQGEFIQSSFRSSAALLGIGFIQNIYGDSGMAPLMIIGTVPLYNIMAVILLSFLKPAREPFDRKLLWKTIKGVLTNPIILGIVVGLAWSLLGIGQPVILSKTVGYLAATATPMGLIALGASIEPGKVSAKLPPALLACFLKLVAFCGFFLPIAMQLGYRRDRLIAILVMLGSPTTVSCYIMAKNMGHEGVLTSSTVVCTTLFSAVSLTLWLFLLKSFGAI